MTQRYEIDVNGYKVKLAKEGEDTPCIRIKDNQNGQIWYAKEIKFLGETKIIQCDPDENNLNKPFIWIETEGPIEWTK